MVPEPHVARVELRNHPASLALGTPPNLGGEFLSLSTLCAKPPVGEGAHPGFIRGKHVHALHDLDALGSLDAQDAPVAPNDKRSLEPEPEPQHAA